MHRYYTEPCLYLDNICVDFRLQRQSIGRILIERGVLQAQNQKLPTRTEASAQGAEFYRRLGFHRLGDWVVQRPGSPEKVELLVMQLCSKINLICQIQKLIDAALM